MSAAHRPISERDLTVLKLKLLGVVLLVVAGALIRLFAPEAA